MLTEFDADAFADKLARATQRVCRDYKNGDVVYEEPFSDQLCGRLKETLVDFTTPNVTWNADVAHGRLGMGKLSARTLTKIKEEPRYGADIVMTLDLDLHNYSVRKGFLAQAKRLNRGHLLSKSDHMKLIGQCKRMLSFTPASMVFLYNEHEVHPIPAQAVLALHDRHLWDIVTYDQRILYRDFAICWFGDTALQATDPASLEGLRRLTDAEVALRISGRSNEDEYYIHDELYE